MKIVAIVLASYLLAIGVGYLVDALKAYWFDGARTRDIDGLLDEYERSKRSR